MKAISLFSGAGGCSLGFISADVNIIAAYDNNPSAIETYNLNFGEDKCQNVDLSTCDFTLMRKKHALKRGEIDLIIGGPPCQGFTTAGNRFWDDPRNKLIQNYVEAIDVFYPRWFVMENVEGILTTAKGDYLLNCIEKMKELGYTIVLEKLYAQEYGVPQRRKRVIIVGNREGKEFSFPSPLGLVEGTIYKISPFTLRQAISDLECTPIPDIDHVIKYETGIQLERIYSLTQGQSMKDLPIELQHPSFARRSNRRVCDGTPTENRGGAPSGLKRLVYDEPSLTITSAAIKEFIHPVENRTLTIRECARIQTFPDEFKFCGTERQRMMQIGNAIPPQLAKLIAIQIINCDKHKPNKEPAGLAKYCVTKANAKSPALEATCAKLDQLLNQKYGQTELLYVN